MATIFKRQNKDETFTYRIQIRRKGIPILCLSFTSLAEAESWVEQHEQIYISNPLLYLKDLNKMRLELSRKREFNEQ